ncbi:MAG: hypothetical protein HQK86_09500 [Nitrospinae bacterium]|nr:hypothetical protein [Nitrospinota bacterium]
MLGVGVFVHLQDEAKAPSFFLPLVRGGGAYPRRRGLIKPPRNFVAIPLTKGDKGVFFTPPFLRKNKLTLKDKAFEALNTSNSVCRFCFTLWHSPNKGAAICHCEEQSDEAISQIMVIRVQLRNSGL